MTDKEHIELLDKVIEMCLKLGLEAFDDDNYNFVNHRMTTLLSHSLRLKEDWSEEELPTQLDRLQRKLSIAENAYNNYMERKKTKNEGI